MKLIVVKNIKTIICSQSLLLIVLIRNTLLKVSSLPRSIPIFSFFTPWKHEKAKGFWCFQGLWKESISLKMDQYRLGHILTLQIMSWANINQRINCQILQLSCWRWTYRFDWKFGLKWFNEYCKLSIIRLYLFRLSRLFERFLWHDENDLNSNLHISNISIFRTIFLVPRLFYFSLMRTIWLDSPWKNIMHAGS